MRTKSLIACRRLSIWSFRCNCTCLCLPVVLANQPRLTPADNGRAEPSLYYKPLAKLLFIESAYSNKADAPRMEPGRCSVQRRRGESRGKADVPLRSCRVSHADRVPPMSPYTKRSGKKRHSLIFAETCAENFLLVEEVTSVVSPLSYENEHFGFYRAANASGEPCGRVEPGSSSRPAERFRWAG